MPEYQLDTSLSREIVAKLDAFTLAYIEALFWLLQDEDGESMDHLGLHDLAPEALESVRNECADFQLMYGHLFRGHESQAGHDFYLTRNGHGAGFWDRGTLYGSEDIGRQLTEACEPYGETYEYVGDDGLVYTS